MTTKIRTQIFFNQEKRDSTSISVSSWTDSEFKCNSKYASSPNKNLIMTEKWGPLVKSGDLWVLSLYICPVAKDKLKIRSLVHMSCWFWKIMGFHWFLYFLFFWCPWVTAVSSECRRRLSRFLVVHLQAWSLWRQLIPSLIKALLIPCYKYVKTRFHLRSNFENDNGVHT